MTGIEIKDRLRYRMEDPNGDDFTSSQIANALNNAQTMIVNHISEEHITELIKTDKNVSTSERERNGSFRYIDYGDLSETQPKRFLKIYCETVGEYARIIPYAQFDQNSTYAYGTIATVHAGQITVSATCLSATVDYLYTPKIGIDSTAHPFPERLMPIMLDLAEAELWRADNKGDRATTVYGNAISQIGILSQ